MANTAGTRFVNAYNLIDHSLRTQYNFKTNISFSDLIRRCSSLNTVIRANEDDLIELARLRNAIIHNSSDKIIAEPHEEVVELMEKIARVISTPPLAIEAIKSKNVATIRGEVTLRDLIIETSRVKFSSIPVYKGNNLIGVIRWRIFIEVLGAVIISSGRSIDKFINETTVEEFIREFPSNNHYIVVSSNVTIEEVLGMLNRDRKLACVLITKDGTAFSPPVGIVTGADTFDLMKILENY